MLLFKPIGPQTNKREGNHFARGRLCAHTGLSLAQRLPPAPGRAARLTELPMATNRGVRPQMQVTRQAAPPWGEKLVLVLETPGGACRPPRPTPVPPSPPLPIVPPLRPGKSNARISVLPASSDDPTALSQPGARGKPVHMRQVFPEPGNVWAENLRIPRNPTW